MLFSLPDVLSLFFLLGRDGLFVCCSSCDLKQIFFSLMGCLGWGLGGDGAVAADRRLKTYGNMKDCRAFNTPPIRTADG